MYSFVLSVILLVTIMTPFNNADEIADLNRNTDPQTQDLTPAASGSSRFFDLSSLFPRPYNTNPYRPTYNPGYYPNTGAYNPGYGGTYNPGYGTGGAYNPGYGGGTGAYNPGYNGYGTNSLGGGGGYGGYGGNGGIGSYTGYYNDQYYGNRNLGYGYYRDTDRYGFYSNPSIGYRGYI